MDRTKKIAASLSALLLVVAAQISSAVEIQRYSLVIAKIRAVGDYQGTTHDNTVELWFTTSLNLPGGTPCTDSMRAYIDARHTHMIAAAYQALASKSRVSINIDSALPVKGGACGISFIDVGGQ